MSNWLGLREDQRMGERLSEVLLLSLLADRSCRSAGPQRILIAPAQKPLKPAAACPASTGAG